MVAASIYIFYYCNYEVMKNRKVDSKSMGHGEGGGGYVHVLVCYGVSVSRFVAESWIVYHLYAITRPPTHIVRLVSDYLHSSNHLSL